MLAVLFPTWSGLARGDMVDTVIVAGKVLMRKRECQIWDEEEVVTTAEKAVASLNKDTGADQTASIEDPRPDRTRLDLSIGECFRAFVDPRFFPDVLVAVRRGQPPADPYTICNHLRTHLSVGDTSGAELGKL